MARAAIPGRLTWQLGRVAELVDETPKETVTANSLAQSLSQLSRDARQGGSSGGRLSAVGVKRRSERTRSITWHDPVALAAAGAELSGREFLEAIIDGQLPPPPIANLIGARLVAVGEGEALFRCLPDESTYNPIGIVHGGFLCTLLDSAAGCAVHTLLPAGVGYGSIEIKVSFLKPLRANSGPIEAHGRALRVGRRVAFAEAHAHDQTGELVGHATTSLALKRPST